MRIRVILSLALAAAAFAQQGRRVDDNVLKNAPKTGEEWLSYGLTPGETRYSPLKQIDASNISRLGLAWTYELGPGGGTQEATPIVWNNTIYGITTWSVVFAVDARTGKELWRWDPEVNQATVRPKICCGVVNRGVAIYDGKIVAPTLDGRLFGLDAITGRPVWETRVAYAQDNYTITIAPRIAKGKAIVGVSGAEFPVRGFIAAYDVKTGKESWRFYTVPGDPSKPFENEAMRKAAATWDSAALKKYAGVGGTVWDAIAYDPDLDLVYFGTGNAGPWPADLHGGGEGKDLLYVDSIVAVDANTGAYKWHYQTVPGDEWDYDSVAHLMLADVVIKGQPRKVIMQANKNGFYYVIDRTNGKFISGQPYASITWAKGLNEETGRPIINKESYYSEKESAIINPGPGGAHNWSPMSFNPATGLVYVPTTAGGGGFTFSTAPNFTITPGRMNLGIAVGGAPAPGQAPAGGEIATAQAAAAAAPRPVTPPAKPVPHEIPAAIGPDATGSALLAWDPVAGKERWRVSGGGASGGGTLSTASNLVIQVLSNGTVRAYTADKGEKVFEVNTGMRNGMGPPVTYMIDGKQYIAMLGGAGQIAPVGYGTEPVVRGAPSPKMLVFTLDAKGTLPIPAPAAAAAPAR